MRASIIIPAYRAADSVGPTVVAAKTLPGVVEVIVVDDGSGDGTAEAARGAGADQVVVLPHNQGKGAALWAGVQAAGGETLLFLDADLGDSAGRAAPLLEAVEGRTAMSIAVFPKRERTGGFGFAKGLSAATIRLLTGLQMEAPLSGQRALPAEIVRHIGLASRWATETALTIEVAHLGIPIIEVPVDLDHHHTGRTGAGFKHRFGQFWDILKYLLLVGYGIGWTGMSQRRTALRLGVWAAGFAALVGLAGLLGLDQAATLMVVSLLSLGLWLPALWEAAIRCHCYKTNYLGRNIPGTAGVLLGVSLLPLAVTQLSSPIRGAALIVVMTFSAIGFVDDVYGRFGGARGLRGHLRALLHGRITTGAVKAIGGLMVGLAVAYLIHSREHTGASAPLPLAEHHLLLVILDGLVIALTANLLNLLDLRPGRALKGFLAIAVLCLVLNLGSLRLLGGTLAAAFVLAPADLSGRVMMGDVGANTLGGVAGLALVLVLPPWGRLVALALLIGVHIYCERASLTDLIARNRVLRWLDRLGTEGRPPLPVGVEEQAT